MAQGIVAERYQQQEMLGQGMMSDVWLVRDITSQQLVVLKVMTAIPEDDKRNEKTRERFEREIEIAQSLHHPQILPIIDTGTLRYQGRSVPYYVTPYIQDGSLAEVIKKTPPWKMWTYEQIGDAILQAAESLWYLHTREPRIVHEDVKPGNFLCHAVQSTHRAVYLYLCDFGISRWQKTASGASEILGTFAYMAPEQAEGDVDRASDQYSLAIMACYLLTGKLPIQAATNKQYIDAHLHQEPLAPSELSPEYIDAEEVDEIILHALEKDPAQRFPTIIEFAQELHRVLKALPQTRVEVPELDEESDEESDDEKVILAQEHGFSSSVVSPIAETLPNHAPLFIEPIEVSERPILDEPLPARPIREPSLPLKGGDVPFVPLSFRSSLRYELPARPKQLCWSHNGNALACVLYGHAPLVLNATGTFQEIHTAYATQASSVCWSHDGRVLAVSAQGEVRFWDTQEQAEMPLVLPTNIPSLESMDWSANGRLALWIDNAILIYTLPYTALLTRQPPLSQRLNTGPMRCGNLGTLRWSPDGAFLAAGGSNGMIVCWSVSHIAPAWHVAPSGQKVYSVSWSPDGSLLAVAFKNNRVIGWNTRTRKQQFVWEKLPAMPRTVSISPTNYITLASSEQRILCGMPNASFPSIVVPGQLLATWSATSSVLATLDEQKPTKLVIWQE